VTPVVADTQGFTVMDQTEEPSTSGRPADSSTKDDGTVVRITQRVYRACIRGFAIGLVLRGGLHAVSSTVQTLRGKRISERFPAQWLDAGRWAAALAMFGSVYVVADESIRHRFGNERRALSFCESAAAYSHCGWSARHQQHDSYSQGSSAQAVRAVARLDHCNASCTRFAAL
jgi:hypothetical protein